MKSLDDVTPMNALDPSDVLGSTGLFAKQCEQAWKESSALVFPEAYRQVSNIVVCGMGGSRFTPKAIKELFKDRIKAPYEIIEDYTLPAYVDSDTLVILSSFSGTTEEVIACGQDAIKRGAKVTAVVGGGAIADMLKQHNFIGYVFDPKYNPCGQPRIGGGYLLMGHLGLLKALQLIDISEEEVQQAIAYADEIGQTYAVTVPEKDNGAKQLARFLLDKHPFLITSEFLRGFGNGFANQINETAKMISDCRYIPELNHHLMEGLRRPDVLHENGVFVFFTSTLYPEKIQKRFRITQDVVQKQNIATHEVALRGKTKLSQLLEAFTLSGYTTFYMAMLYDNDPVAIPWVSYFKEQLAAK
jgi:glucose/mannose-6-phosphate isomerase